MKKIIGISGKLASGKDTISEMIADILNIPVEKYTFSKKLKDIVSILTGEEMQKIKNLPYANTIYDYTREQKNKFLPIWNKTLGEYLQQLGTDVMRKHFDYDIWIKSLFETDGKQCLNRGNIMTIPDVRFVNEADEIIKRGGLLIRVNGDPLKIRANTSRDVNHISETALDYYNNFNYVVDNDIPNKLILKDKIYEILKLEKYF